MPPKAKELPVGPRPADTNPYGVFVNVSVPSALLSWAPVGESAEPKAPPCIQLSLSHSPDFLPVLSHIMEAADDTCNYALNSTLRFRQDPTLDALHGLLNQPPVLSVLDASGALLASVVLDCTDLGLGHHTMTLHDLALTLAPPPSAPQPMSAASSPGKPSTTPAAAKKGAPMPEAVTIPLTPRYLAAPPQIPLITVFLTHRPAPEGFPTAGGGTALPTPAPTAPGSPAVSKSSTPTAGGRAAAAAAEAPPALADDPSLPEPTPYSFLPEGELGAANVVTLRLALPGPLPQGLLTANDAVPGKLSLSAALQLPGPGPCLSFTGSIVKDAAGGPSAVAWGGQAVATLKRVVTGVAVSALLAALESSGSEGGALGLELTRTVGEDKAMADTQVAWDAYHGWAPLPGADCLLECGATRLPSAPDGSAPIGEEGEQLVAPVLAWPLDRPSALPAFVPPPGKVKALEEVPVSVSSTWAFASVAVLVSLSWAKPLVAPWQAPPTPSPSLQELVPQRELHPVLPPPTAPQELSAHLGTLLKELAVAYQAHQLAERAQPGAGQSPEQVHKPFIRKLNATGQYVAWREALKAPLLRVVREQLGKSGTMGPVEMGDTYQALHAALLNAAHTAIHSAAQEGLPAPPQQPEPKPSPEELAALADSAWEAVVADQPARAAAFLARRCLDADNPQVHLDASRLACKQGRLADARLAVKAALEIEPGHVGALATAAALHTAVLLQAAGPAEAVSNPDAADGVQCEAPSPAQEGVEGRQALALALATGHALLAAADKGGLAWALLHLAYLAGGRTAEAQACLQELKRRERTAIKAAAAGAEAGMHTPDESAGLVDIDAVQEDSLADAADAPPSPAPALPPPAAPELLVGVVPLWALAVQLGLRPLADAASRLARGPFARSSGGGMAAALRLSLLTAQTHLVKPQTGAVLDAADLRAAKAAAKTACAQAKQVASTAQAASVAEHEQNGASERVQSETLQLHMALPELRPQLLMADEAWEQAELAQGAAQGQEARSKARRCYQQILQTLHDGGFLHAAAAAGGLRPLVASGGAADEEQVAAVALLLRGLLRLTHSYIQHTQLPVCARDVATALVALWPNAGTAWSAAATASAACGDAAAAGHCWAQANLCDPWDGRSWAALALNSFREGRQKDALQALKRALELHDLAAAASLWSSTLGALALPPSDPGALLAAAAQSCAAQGEYWAAAAHARTGLNLPGGDSSKVRLALAEALRNMGDVLGAREQTSSAQGLARTPLERQAAGLVI